IAASAYSVGRDRVVGGEGWMDSLPYVIEAKADDSLKATRIQLIQMLQNLLAERFKLKFHRETKDASGFLLVLKTAEVGLAQVSADAPRRGITIRPGSLEGEATAALIANAISGPLGVPVVDKTGLTRRYRISLK